MDEILINEDTEPIQCVIPNIYNYSPITKEYTGIIEQADKDPAKSAQVGHFVPMVHANATLLEPPSIKENEIQVYSKVYKTHKEPYDVIDPETGEKHTEYKTVTEVIENWNIEPDYRKNFLKVDNDLNVSDIITIGEQEGYIIVDKAIGENIKVNKDWYKIVNDEIVKKSEEEYEEEQAQKEKERIAKLSLTKREVFLALYKAKQVTPDMIKAQIGENVEALIEFEYAEKYYRFNPLIDTIGGMLGYTASDLDYLFEHKEFPEPVTPKKSKGK